VTFYCAFACLRYITGIKKRAGFIGAGLAVIIYCISTFALGTSRDLHAFIHAIPWLIAALMIAVPAALLILTLTKRGHKKDVQQTVG